MLCMYMVFLRGMVTVKTLSTVYLPISGRLMANGEIQGDFDVHNCWCRNYQPETTLR